MIMDREGKSRREIDENRIAVIGMAGRFPGARNIESFWKNLKNGVESISHFTEEELAKVGIPPEVLSNPRYVRAKGFIEDIVSKANSTNPDIVVITGDLIDVDVHSAKETLFELTKLDSIYGTYYIVGNHEYFHNIEEIITAVKSLGIRVLENENVYIGEAGRGFNLAGVYDMFGYRSKKYMPDLQRALQNTEDAPTLLLAHQPRFIYEVENGVDLILSGHTHGGQLYPFKYLVQLQQPYVSGLHRHNEDLQIYVNKGTGFWGPPMRLGASSEITEMLIKPL